MLTATERYEYYMVKLHTQRIPTIQAQHTCSTCPLQTFRRTEPYRLAIAHQQTERSNVVVNLFNK